MTGHQPHPGADQSCLGPACQQVDIEAVVRGCGVTQVARIKSYNVKAAIKTFTEMKESSGVRVVIAEEPCVLFARRALGRKPVALARVDKQEKGSKLCMETLACPAFCLEGEEMSIDATLCSGCMVCLQITSDIKAEKRTA